MFDFFGSKRIKELESQLVIQGTELRNARALSLALDAKCSGLNAQLMEVRQIAAEMRDRVRSNGKTQAESFFIRQCVEIRQAGKTIAPPRFMKLVDEVIEARTMLVDWEACKEKAE